MKKLIGFLVFVALVTAPLYPAHAQEFVDQQFIAAAEGLDADVQLEFLELIRDPGEWGGAFERLGVTPELADRIEERMDSLKDRAGSWEKEHKIEKTFEKLETIDDKVERKLANIRDDQDRKAEKTIEKALKKVDKVLAKAEKDKSKDGDKDKDQDKDKDKDEDEDEDKNKTPGPDQNPKDKDKKK